MNYFQRIKAFFNYTPEQLQLHELIEITSNDVSTRQQETRKRNLQLVIQQLFHGNIAEFAKILDKNLYFIKSLISPVNKFGSRKLTDEIARLLEANLYLQTGTLDSASPDFCQHYVPFIDGLMSVKEYGLCFSLSRPSEYYENSNLAHHVLLDVAEFDEIICGGIVARDAVVVVNRNSQNKLTVWKNKKSLTFNGEIVGTFTKRENHD